jgi:hypothetical protein
MSIGQGIITKKKGGSGGGSGTTVAIHKNSEVFTATAGQTAFTCPFTLGGTYNVFVDGYLYDSTQYAKTAFDTITFNDALSAGQEVIIYNFYLTSSGGVVLYKQSQTFTATAGQKVFNTTFDLEDTYTIFIDGYIIETGFTKTGAKQITFTDGKDAGTQVVIQNYIIS